MTVAQEVARAQKRPQNESRSAIGERANRATGFVLHRTAGHPQKPIRPSVRCRWRTVCRPLRRIGNRLR